MKILKPSFTAFTAIVSFCVTFSVNAEKKRTQVTRCYRLCDLMNNTPGAGSYRPYMGTQSCALVRSNIDNFFNDYKWLGPFYPAWSIDTGCSTEMLNYCCVVFELDPTAPSHVPTFTIDGLSGKFKVHEVLCRED